jgi:hypothetical protein
MSKVQAAQAVRPYSSAVWLSAVSNQFSAFLLVFADS